MFWSRQISQKGARRDIKRELTDPLASNVRYMIYFYICPRWQSSYKWLLSVIYSTQQWPYEWIRSCWVTLHENLLNSRCNAQWCINTLIIYNKVTLISLCKESKTNGGNLNLPGIMVMTGFNTSGTTYKYWRKVQLQLQNIYTLLKKMKFKYFT